MPPKSKAKTNKKNDKKILTKSDSKSLARDTTIKIKGSKEKVLQSILRQSSFPDHLKLGRSVASLREQRSTQGSSGPRKLQMVQEDPLKKILAEISISSSSSESEIFDHDDIDEEEEEEEEEEAYYNKKAQKPFLPDASRLFEGAPSMPGPDEVVDALDTDAADESSDEDLPEYLKQEPLAEVADFFGNIGDVPDVEELSIDVSVEKLQPKVKSKPKAKPGVQADVGKFVDPLTGEALVSEESTEEEVKVVVEKPKQVEDEPLMVDGRVVREIKILPPASDDEVSIDILSDQEQEDEESATKVVDEESTFNQFLELDTTAPVLAVEDIDIEALLLEENARILREQTYEFIQYLINMAVDDAEYVDPAKILRQNLDKRKLMKELSEKVILLEVERKGKRFLNKKCVEYYRRKRTFRPILEDNPKFLNLEYQKYQAALTSMDRWLIKEEEAQTVSKKSLQVARAQIMAENARSQAKVKELEELISKTLKRENFDHLQQFVKRTLKQMGLVRKEISDVRFQLIQKQHTMASLIEQLHALEDLGNGLSMRDFEAMHTETQTLGKKIEERHAELNKLRIRCHSDIHRLSHQKEKQSMLRESIANQRQYMDDLEMDKQNLREFLHKMKIARNRLRKVIRDKSFQSGLLDKPALLKDYDTTTEYLADLRSRIEDYHVTIKTINDKIELLEQQCNNK